MHHILVPSFEITSKIQRPRSCDWCAQRRRFHPLEKPFLSERFIPLSITYFILSPISTVLVSAFLSSFLSKSPQNWAMQIANGTVNSRCVDCHKTGKSKLDWRHPSRVSRVANRTVCQRDTRRKGNVEQTMKRKRFSPHIFGCKSLSIWC